MEARRAEAAEKEAAARRATEAQVLEDAGRLVAAWTERQAKRMPMLFSPTIGCALKGAAMVPLGVLSSVPHDAGGRSSHLGSPPMVRDQRPHPVAVMPLVPTARAVRRAGPPVRQKHR